LPNLLDEFLTPDLAAPRLLPLHHAAFHHHLGGDARVVHARLPEHVLAAHALEAHQNVLDGIVERVPDMERAGHVGRRDNDRIALGAGLAPGPRLESPSAFPGLVNTPFNRRRFVGLFDHLCRYLSLECLNRPAYSRQTTRPTRACGAANGCHFCRRKRHKTTTEVISASLRNDEMTSS